MQQALADKNRERQRAHVPHMYKRAHACVRACRCVRLYTCDSIARAISEHINSCAYIRIARTDKRKQFLHILRDFAV